MPFKYPHINHFYILWKLFPDFFKYCCGYLIANINFNNEMIEFIHKHADTYDVGDIQIAYAFAQKKSFTIKMFKKYEDIFSFDD